MHTVTRPTLTEIETAMKTAHVMYECIAAAGEAGIPSGHVYAATMSAFASLGAYEACLGLLVKAGLVARQPNHILVAVAPKAG